MATILKGNPDHLTVGEVAAELLMSEWTLYRLINKGEFLRGMRLGERTIRWKRSDVATYLEKKDKERFYPNPSGDEMATDLFNGEETSLMDE